MKIKEILRNKWGWAGAVIGAVGMFFGLSKLTVASGFSQSTLDLIAFPWKIFQKIACSNPVNCSDVTGMVITGMGVMVISYAIFGFLLGWGIHSIFRRFVK